MNLYNFLPRLRARLSDDNAQVLPMMAVLMVGFLGMAALVADVGDVYYSYNELVASTNAAALAGGAGMGTSAAQATTNVDDYGASTGEKNQFGNLNVSASAPQVSFGCASDYSSVVPCKFGTGADANAIQVKQTAQVKTYFAALFGTPYVNLTATSSALMGSPNYTPRNIAIIIDTTESMSTSDTSCGKGNTRLTCSEQGIQTLLAGLQPCESVGCGSLSSGNYQNAADRVALFTFPELSNSGQQQYDTDCSSKNPSITPYTFPSSTGTSYNPGTTGGDYQVTPFSSNYQTVTSGSPTGTLNGGTGSSASGVVDAVGGGGCAQGMGDPGGEGTYYAGVLYAAQAALLAEQASLAAQSPSIASTNSIIIVSDGAATASSKQMAGGNSTGVYTTTGSYNDECEQSVTAANAIKAQGTTIYSIAYGSPTTGCTTDKGSYASPCYSMQQMAGNQANPSLGTNSPYFYSDDENGVGSCPASATTPAAGGAGLGGIFGQILANLGPARLIPNASFPSS